MSDEVQVTGDESPRPWTVDHAGYNDGWADIMDARGNCVAPCVEPEAAALIVRAVNNRDDLLKAREMLQEECHEMAVEADRLADLVRRLCDMIADHPVWRPSEAERRLIAEARKAVGECARIEAAEKRT